MHAIHIASNAIQIEIETKKFQIHGIIVRLQTSVCILQKHALCALYFSHL